MKNGAGFPNLKKNDVVVVISGKYKGQSGKILRLIRDKGMVVVEKINVIKRHTKPSKTNPQGGIVEKEAPLYVCKVLPILGRSKKPVRISKWHRESRHKESEK